MVRRLVGFLEYGKALDYFDELLRRVTDEERDVIDKIVAENDAFVIYVKQSGPANRQPESSSEKTRHPNERRGLAWEKPHSASI